MSGYVPAAVRRLVVERAGERCEYCRYPQAASFLTFEVEHYIAEKPGGETVAENLALACPYCNTFKGTDLGSLDPESGRLTPFFNPRADRWEAHFRLQGAGIVALTAECTTTAAGSRCNAGSTSPCW